MRCKVAALTLLFVLCPVGALQAQSTNATVTGRVTDPSKAVIADAKVTLISTATNLRYEGTTNRTGTYYVTNLPARTYRMEVEMCWLSLKWRGDVFR
jgi:Carboxypeptidase regulatory-like domain